MTDAHVSLRAIDQGDLPFLQELISDPRDAPSLMWQPFAHPHQWQHRWEAGNLVGDHNGTVLVIIGDQPAGYVSWDEHRWFGHPCWSLGIHLTRSLRGQGIGTRAHQLTVTHLFAWTLLNRIEAHTAIDNAPERRALEKAGFTLEGTLQGACFRHGQWYDGVLYSILREHRSTH